MPTRAARRAGGLPGNASRKEVLPITARTLAWTGFIAIAAFVLMGASRLTLLDPIENVTLNVTAPAQTTMRSITRPVADWVNNLTDAGALSSENQRLRAENERLTSELARAREGSIEQARALELADAQAQFPEGGLLAASVVARDSSNLRALIAIDKGSSDGVREGMIIVSAGPSLVGRVSKTFGDYAWVTLITDPTSAVSARVQESRSEGVVAGNYGGDLRMEFVGQGAAVKEGDFVLTSGVGGSYPEGIVIGRVSEISRTEQDLFQQVSVDHLASLAGIEDVLVVTSFEPSPIAQP